MAVVEQAAVAVDGRVRAFWKNPGNPFSVETGVQFSAAGSLNAMRGPQRLWQSFQHDLIEWFFPGMARRETPVIRRMPILRGDHERECRLEFVRDGNDRVSLRHGQRAARQEVVLNVNEDERPGCHFSSRARST